MTRLVLLLLTGLLPAACGISQPLAPQKADAYLYEDTRRLVESVESAADLLEQRGAAAAFAEFSRRGSRWHSTHLFVYDAGGTCLWHDSNRLLVGRNLLAFRDALGKPVVELITGIARRPDRAAAEWIFYMWEDGTEFLPKWQSAYVRKAGLPDGRVYLVGISSSLLKIEKAFVREQVDAAARLVILQGRETAFRELRSPSSRFYFLETFVFVLDANGRSIVDPGSPTFGGRDMSDFRDAVGRPVLQEVLEKLGTADSAWTLFLWPRPGRTVPSRKLLYVRKIQVGGETLLIGSDFFPATPIWMRG
jgi:cytochrome c